MSGEEQRKPVTSMVDIDPWIDEGGERHGLAAGEIFLFEALEELDEPATVLEPTEREVTVRVSTERLMDVRPERAFEVDEGSAIVPPTLGDASEGGMGADRTDIASEGLTIESHGFVLVAEGERTISSLTAVVGEKRIKVLIARPRETERRLIGSIPIVLVFVDREESSQGSDPMGRIAGDVFEERFGAIVEARGKIIAGEFIEGTDVDGTGKIGAGDEALMDADRSLEFALATEQVGQGELDFVGLGLELGKTQEDVEGAIGLVVEEKAETFERATHGAQQPTTRTRTTLTVAGERHGDDDRHEEEEEENIENRSLHGSLRSVVPLVDVGPEGTRSALSRRWRRAKK